MYRKRKPNTEFSAFATWIQSYIKENEISITELARQSDMSPGAIRNILSFPDRVPSLETCLKLSRATGTPMEDLVRLAEIESPGEIGDEVQPDQIELTLRYSKLPPELRRAMIELSRAFEEIAARNNLKAA